ncbi:ATP-binding protein [Chitinimonas sp. BJB300]|nr:ATP-binding protein [Chitinimonas sp. BJB300]TSJ90873.1 sensor histidine kinase [Chitinimonas sp. BJB300]
MPVFRERILPLLLVGLVWLSLLIGSEGPVSRMLLIAQYGLLLLWQPVFDTNLRINRAAVARLVLVGIALALLAGKGLMLCWLALLASMFGSRSIRTLLPWQRRFHVGMLLCLLYMLWLVGTPGVANHAIPFESVFKYGVPVVLLLLAMLPVVIEPKRQRASLDFFDAVLILLLALLVPMGAVALDALSDWSYVESLALVLVGLGLGLGAFAWLWNPRAGFAGIGALFSMRVLQLGTPFERWSTRLAAHSNREASPEQFLRSAAADLLTLPGVVGGDWRYDQSIGRFGVERARFNASVKARGLVLMLLSEHPIPPALHLQFQLIAELLSQFYQAKLREIWLAEQAYVEAVHQTGARLTHDIKNLLQTLKLLLAASETMHDAERSAALYSRQLPEITRRLEITLKKLTLPLAAEPMTRVIATSWWELQKCRYIDSDVDFVADDLVDAVVDEDLFTAALDNLISNALNKRLLQPSLYIHARLAALNGEPILTVVDDGEPVPADLLGKILIRPVPSSTGFGLGLYQVAKMAAERGYMLALSNNRDGCVEFSLKLSG